MTAGELEARNTAESAATAGANVGVGDDGDRPLQKSTLHYSLPVDLLTCKLIYACNIFFASLSLSAAIELRIDRRCTLAELKTRLEEYVHVLSSEFKVRLKRAYPGHYCSSVHARSSFVPYCRKFLPFLLPALMGKFFILRIFLSCVTL